MLENLTKRRIKPRGYGYVPRYYDEKKEKFDEQLEKTKQKYGLSDKKYTHGSIIKDGFTRNRSYQNYSISNFFWSNIRFIIILLVLFYIAYTLHYSPKIVNFISQLFGV